MNTVEIYGDSYDISDQAMTDYLLMLRKILSDQDSVILDVFEYVRYKMRVAAGVSNGISIPVKTNIIKLPVISAYFYARIMQRAVDIANGQVPQKARESILTFIELVDQALRKKYARQNDKLDDKDQEQINYLYIDYLDSIYLSATRKLNTERQADLYLLLCKQIQRRKDYLPYEKEYMDTFQIFEYAEFNEVCAKWMRENETESIYLEDIMDSEYFALK